MDMPALHCLACEHENPRGENICQKCGSTLNLKLCKQCEAINEIKAPACHKCGIQFGSARLTRARTAAIAAGVCTVLAVSGLAYQFVYRQPVAGASNVARQPAVGPIVQPVATTPAEDKAAATTAPEKKKPATPAPAPATSGTTRTAVTHTRPAGSQHPRQW
ncbi:MAG TPA: zinc ribbon domain-containing protein [Burkholderiales bacterium]|nr:zinc ribbon domain-containing protein [Burkholderiales bacterium]